jgi:hypothetical protein
MIRAATAKATAMASSVSGPPTVATRPAASGGPRIVATTYPFESTALTRSHRWRGTRIGKRLRRPVWLKIPVIDAMRAITTRSPAGSDPAIASAAIETSDPRATT